jgi:hypothetical protein
VDEWKECLESIRDSLELIPFDATLNNNKWLTHLKGELMNSTGAVHDLYRANWNGGVGADMLRSLLAVYCKEAQKMTAPLLAEDARYFLEMLQELSDSPLLRCAVLRMKLNNDAVRTFASVMGKKAAVTGKDYVAFLRETKRNLNALNKKSRVLFLYYHKYPGADVGIKSGADEMFKTKMCDPEDLQWYGSVHEQRTTGRLAPPSEKPHTLEEFRELTGKSCVLRFYTHYINNIDALMYVMSTVDKKDIVADLDSYVELLFQVDHTHVAQLFKAFVDAKLLDHDFYSTVLKVGMTAKNLLGMTHFMLNMLYEGCDGTPSLARSTEFSSAAAMRMMGALPSFPAEMFNTLYSAVMENRTETAIAKNHDGLDSVVELLLCFEQSYGGGGNMHMQTLSRWLSSETGAAKAARATKIKTLFQEINFASHIEKIFDNSVHVFDPSNEPGERAALAPALSIDATTKSFFRSKEKVQLIVYGYIKVCLNVDPNMIVDVFSRLQDWQDTLMSTKEPLRELVVEAIFEVPAYQNIKLHGAQFMELMKNGQLLNHNLHFSDAVLQALAIPKKIAGNADVAIVTSLVAVALRLKDLENLDSKVTSIWDGVKGNYEQKDLLDMILKRTLKRIDSDGIDFMFPTMNDDAFVSISDLGQCAVCAIEAFSMVVKAPLKRKLLSVFESYLCNMSPGGWVKAFEGAETVALFLKYMACENLDLALRRFDHANMPCVTGETLYQKLADVVKNAYKAPLVAFEDIEKVQSTEEIEKLVNRIIQSGGPTQLQELLKKLTGYYLRHSYNRIGIAMAPRNAQIITFLTFATWAQKRFGAGDAALAQLPDMPRTLVARVGTGEGKSLIIAMLSVLFAKLLNKKVHVLESNQGLMERDHFEYKDFFKNFDLTSSTSLDAKCNITYCTKRALDAFYRDNVGKEPFKNTVLLVDEVDALIVDDKPFAKYASRDIKKTAEITRIFAAFKAGNGASCSASPFFQEASDAVKQAELRERKGRGANGGYHVENQRCSLILDGTVRRNIVSLPMEYLSFKLFDTPPVYQSSFFYMSTPHMLLQYDGILGLSGSLGSDGEINFLKRTYDADTFLSPPFLDTCTGTGKQKPVLVDKQVLFFEKSTDHRDAVVEAAKLKSVTTPVIVLCTSREAAKEMWAAFKTEAEQVLAGKISGNAQLFLEEDLNNVRMNHRAVADLAARPIKNGNDIVTWRITVTDLFGGRGQDYRVSEKCVDDAGGITVLATGFPPSEREWTQWLGRTARNDRKGQFMLLLDKSSRELSAVTPEMLKKHPVPAGVSIKKLFQPKPAAKVTVCGETVIVELLRIRNTTCTQKLSVQEGVITCGRRLNELCDAFWTQEKGFNNALWPANARQEKLRDILVGKVPDGAFSVEDVDAWAQEVGIVLPPRAT